MRYAQLNSEGVESGHFRYHLTQLIKDGSIEQAGRGLYRLTTKGQHRVDTLSEHRVNATPMPKVITYTLLRDGDMVILQNKQKQPYLGLLNMIGGKMHEAETSVQAAVREVHEKTGKDIAPPGLAGIFEVIIRTGHDVLTHAMAYVFVADIDADDFDVPSLRAVDVTQLESLTDLAPDFLPIFHQIWNSSALQVSAIDTPV